VGTTLVQQSLSGQGYSLSAADFVMGILSALPIHIAQIKPITIWEIILKALLSKAFKITYFSALARRNGS